MSYYESSSDRGNMLVIADSQPKGCEPLRQDVVEAIREHDIETAIGILAVEDIELVLTNSDY